MVRAQGVGALAGDAQAGGERLGGPGLPRVGITLDAGVSADVAELLDALGRLARRAAEVGMHSIWVGESHPRGPGQSHLSSPTLVIADLARQTRGTDVTLGGVVLAPLWHPLRLAYEAAVLDRLCEGRLVLALGKGPVGVRRRYVAGGFSGRVFDELLVGLRAWWAGEGAVAVDGITYEGPIWPLPTRPGGIPLWIAGRSDATAVRAARHGDAWYGGTPASYQEVMVLAALYRRELRLAGHPDSRATVALNRIAVIAETEAEALRAARPYVERELRYYRDMGALRDHDGLPDDVELVTALRQDLLLIGTPEQVLARLRDYAAIGVTDVHLRVNVAGFPLQWAHRTVELLAQALGAADSR